MRWHCCVFMSFWGWGGNMLCDDSWWILITSQLMIIDRIWWCIVDDAWCFMTVHLIWEAYRVRYAIPNGQSSSERREVCRVGPSLCLQRITALFTNLWPRSRLVKHFWNDYPEILEAASMDLAPEASSRTSSEAPAQWQCCRCWRGGDGAAAVAEAQGVQEGEVRWVRWGWRRWIWRWRKIKEVFGFGLLLEVPQGLRV